MALIYKAEPLLDILKELLLLISQAQLMREPLIRLYQSFLRLLNPLALTEYLVLGEALPSPTKTLTRLVHLGTQEKVYIAITIGLVFGRILIAEFFFLCYHGCFECSNRRFGGL